ncbi:MAG: MBL fold metallo-hydrolase [Thermoproteota archaeon]|jgi:putative mRNA 3-end processing factor|nr:MBL fold metallo-hydrolase [Thermoproteota archaeon]
MSINIRILGAGQEVGRNAIEITHENSSILLDYGAYFNSIVDFPLPPTIKQLRGIICSHAHLDHSAGLPLIYGSSRPPPLYMNSMTLDLINLLLYDFIKIAKDKIQFDSSVLNLINKHAIIKDNYSEFYIDNFYIRTLNAGHIPGSWIVFVEVNNKKILYTGDINVYDSFLLKSADIMNDPVDLMICESTYACVNHIKREILISELVDRTLEILENGGNVLIPSFSVGRSQEIACIFEENKLGYPIYMDGMARAASEIMLKHPEYFKNYELLKRAISNLNIINSKKDRKEAMNEPSIIISPAGMLKGGAAIYYVNKIAKDPKSAIFFVGYLSKETPGREVLEKRVIQSEKGIEPVLAQLDWFGISSHADMSGLINYIKKVNPEKLILIHGEYFRMIEMSKLIKEELDIECFIPKNGEEFQI